MSKAEEKRADQAGAINTLRGMIKPGDTVYCILRSRSSSGMSRVIDLVIADKRVDLVYPKKADGSRDYDAKPKRKTVQTIRNIGFLVARAMDRTFDNDKGGIRIGGCGMDMGFSLVYDLGSTLWPSGTPRPHGRRNGEPDRAGGYAIKHSWL